MLTLVLTWTMFKWLGIPLLILAVISFTTLLGFITDHDPGSMMLRILFAIVGCGSFFVWIVVMVLRAMFL